MTNPLRLDRLVLPAILLLSWAAVPATNAAEEKPKDYDPYVMYAFPAGGQRGTTVETMLRGRGLEGTTEARVSGDGVTAKIIAIEKPDAKLVQRSKNRQDQSENPNVVRVAITIAPDAELGMRDLRLLTPKGATNRFRFVVGQLAEVAEVEPNSLPSEVQPLPSLPVLINGQVDQGDRDFFRFSAKAGQTIVCEFQGQKLLPYIADAVPGWLQASLTLYDDAGNEVAYNDDYRFHPDPLLIFKVPNDGDYVVEVKDALFRGREDLIYRLSIGELPFITHAYPLGGRRGSDVQIALHGVNLSTETVTITLPADAPPRSDVWTDGNGLTSNPLPLAVTDVAEAAETEPNDAADKANKIELPATINGRIQQRGDADYFTFNVQQKQRIIVNVRARRLESPLDSIVTLFDAKGRQLAENDDTVDKGAGLVTHQADSRIDYTLPAAGDYVLRIADVQGKGGDEYAYRIAVGPPRPDYSLLVTPDNPRLGRTGTVLMTAHALRSGGFNGKIDLALQNLPPGCVVSGASIPAGQAEARFTISAPADAPLGLVLPTVTGTASLAAGGTAAIGDQTVVRLADPAENAMQAFIYYHLVRTAEQVLTVVEPGPLELSADLPSEGPLEIKQGASVDVVVKVARKEGVTGPVRLVAVTPPRGITVKQATIAPDKSEATITITATKAVAIGFAQNVIITGSMKVGKQNVTRHVPAVAISVVSEVRQPKVEAEPPKPK